MDSNVLAEAQRYVEESNTFKDGVGIGGNACIELHPLGYGEHNANFWFVHPDTGEKLVLRANYASQQGLSHQSTYEFNALRALEPCDRAPRPVFVDESRSVVPRGMSVITFVEGGVMDYESVEDLSEVARVLADIHSVEVAPDCPILKPKDALFDLYEEDACMYESYRRSAYADGRVCGYIDHFFATVKGLLEAPPGVEDVRQILNTEAVADHFLIPRKGEGDGRAHMIDWDKPVLGEAVRDVAYFVSPTTTVWTTEFVFDPQGRAAFVEQYRRAVDARFDLGLFEERFPAFLKLNALRGVTWSANAYAEYHDPARPLQSEFRRRKLDLYLSDEFLQMLKDDIFDNDALC